ncbi:MAG: type II toxin-antitoxin system VapC family toxin [Armatimonadetes bacterium]|nr:type II toxin-antitoxin system VapC family toxin [Armatimonadota bacterium]
MIVIDTHIWIWYTDGGTKLPPEYRDYVADNVATGIGVSAISCWEVAKLAEGGRLQFAVLVQDWIANALSLPGIIALDITPQIAVDSVQLPGSFHKDPADRLIVATAREANCPLVTLDLAIHAYPHVLFPPGLAKP